MTLKDKVAMLEKEIASLKEALNMYTLLASKQPVVQMPIPDPPSYPGYPWIEPLSTGTPLLPNPITTCRGRQGGVNEGI